MSEMLTRRALGPLAVSMLAVATTAGRSEASTAAEIDIDVTATLNRLFLEG